MTEKITLGGVMKHRIGSTVRLERTRRAAREGLVARRRKQAAESIPGKNASVRVVVNIPETERRVMHFGKHARFIACIHIAVIVVHEHTHTSARGRSKVNVPGG